jgi:hypothetical protein
MSQIDFNQFLADLSIVSEKAFIDPGDFDWPDQLDPDAWYFSPELISLYGTDVWDSLKDEQRKRLSFYEAVNFFSLNIHGEKYLVSEISRRLYVGEESELSRYLTHFIDEEARHMMYFSGFCRRYANKIYSDRTMQDTDSGDAELDMFLLFARINLFEEIVDYYNRVMARDNRLAPVVREINRIHHFEELRHLNFGRNFLRHSLDRHIDDWDEARQASLREHLSSYLKFVWKQYYNPDVYRDAGLADAFATWRTQANAPIAKRHREAINRRRLGFLRKLNLLEAA